MARQLAEMDVERQEALAVPRRNAHQHLAHALAVAPPGQNYAVRHHGLHRRFGRDHPQSLSIELQVTDDLRTQHACHVRRSGDATSRRGVAIDLLGDAAAADNLAPLQHQRAQPGAGEIERCRQSVVACADDDCVVAGCHACFLNSPVTGRRGAARDSGGYRDWDPPSGRRSRRGTRASASRPAPTRRSASPAC